MRKHLFFKEEIGLISRMLTSAPKLNDWLCPCGVCQLFFWHEVLKMNRSPLKHQRSTNLRSRSDNTGGIAAAAAGVFSSQRDGQRSKDDVVLCARGKIFRIVSYLRTSPRCHVDINHQLLKKNGAFSLAQILVEHG